MKCTPTLFSWIPHRSVGMTNVAVGVCNHIRKKFPRRLAYNRFVWRQAKAGLKNVCNMEHMRHRPIDNFASNMTAGLFAYNPLPKKPSMNIGITDKSRLIA